jgi:hypothetical protein
MGFQFDWKCGPIRYAAPFSSMVFAAIVALLFASTPVNAQSDEAAPPEVSSPAPEADASAPADADADTPDADVPPYTGSGPIEDEAGAGQVLEVPQQVDQKTVKAASAGPTDDSSDASDSPDQVGSISDYEDQPEVDEAAVIPGGVPAGMISVPVIQAMPSRFGTVTGLPPSPIIVGPAGVGPFPATSPMLSAPRFGVVVPGRIYSAPRGGGSIPGGWWTRAHR